MKKTQLNLAVITTFSALAVPNVFAQEVSVPQINTDIEKIQVTGSRINRTDMETASPVTIISSDFIAKSGYTPVQDILTTFIYYK